MPTKERQEQEAARRTAQAAAQVHLEDKANRYWCRLPSGFVYGGSSLTPDRCLSLAVTGMMQT